MDPPVTRKRPPGDDKREDHQGSNMKAARKSHQPTVQDKRTQWNSLVPAPYDWLTNYKLSWPSLSCRWGPQIDVATYDSRHRIYLSEQECVSFTDGSVPNTLIIAKCEVVKPRDAAVKYITQFNEETCTPFLKKYKTIIHPGEVNRIKELPQNANLVATHTDSPDVLIWDVEAQPDRHAVSGATNSRPDLILTGHHDNAEYALAMSPAEPYVLSGGKDKSVVLWSIQDHVSGFGGSITKPGRNDKTADAPTLEPRGVYNGHEDTVEDVTFCPSSAQRFCSVGDDSRLILWDARTGRVPVIQVKKAPNADLHCVDWNPHDDNLILTGSADNFVHIFDLRRLTSNGVGPAVHKFVGHEAAVLCVQWSPHKSSVFGSSAEDGCLNIWDYDMVGKKPETAAGLLFPHRGHSGKVVDFHWNASDPWTIVSVSDDCETTEGGGTLQIWRMSDLMYRPE